MKITHLAAAISLWLVSIQSMAAEQYLVRVPANVNLSVSEAPAPQLSLVLSAEQPDPGMVGTPFSFSLPSRLSINNETGSYDLGDVAWSLVSGALPAGLLLQPGGLIFGTPTSKTHESGNEIVVSAQYREASASQTYVLKVDQKACDAPPLVLNAAATTSVTVPDGCTIAEVKAWGAGGGGGRAGYNDLKVSSGGSGAFAHARVGVTPGYTLTAIVGGGGGVVNHGMGSAIGGSPGSGGSGGYNNGGASVNGGGGGGYTGLFDGVQSQATALVVAAGAGGGSSGYSAGIAGGGRALGTATSTTMRGTNGYVNGDGGGGGGYEGGGGRAGGLSYVKQGGEIIAVQSGNNGNLYSSSWIAAPAINDPDYASPAGQGGAGGPGNGFGGGTAYAGQPGRMVIYWH